MKKILTLTVLFSLLASFQLNAQSQIPNSNFENWEEFHYNSLFPNLYYDRPLPNDYWNTGNPAMTIVNDFSTEKSTDAHSGTYAARMETKSVFGVMAAGNLFVSEFVEDGMNSYVKFGRAWGGDRPTHVKFYYKYTSILYDSNGVSVPDQMAFYTIFSKWDGNQRVDLGSAEMYSSTTVNTYQEVVIPFIWTSQDTPDTITVVFSSSRNGEQMMGGVGSTLLVDDLELQYNTSIEEAESANSFYTHYDLSAAKINCRFNGTVSGELQLIDLNGALISSQEINAANETGVSVNGYRSGMYIVRFIDREHRLSTNKKIIIW